jgi:autotransporter-associated beta strand protein
LTKGTDVAHTGTLTLSAANTYTGATSINNGTVVISNNTSLGTIAGATTVASGATLQVAGSGSLSSAEPLTIAGAGLLSAGAVNFSAAGTLSGTVALSADATVQVANSTTGTMSGVVSGSFGLSKGGTGAGTLALSGANTYTGATSVNVGTVAISHNTALGTTDGATSVASGATLSVSGGLTDVAESITISGSGMSGAGALLNTSGDNKVTQTVVLGAAATVGSTSGTLTLDVSGAGTALSAGDGTSYGLSVVGAGNVTVADVVATPITTLTKGAVAGDTGTLTLSAANTYTGATSVPEHWKSPRLAR